MLMNRMTQSDPIHIGFLVLLFFLSPLYLILSIVSTHSIDATNKSSQNHFFGPGSSSGGLIMDSPSLLLRRRRDSNSHTNTSISKGIVSIEEVISFLSDWIHTLEHKLVALQGHDYTEIWEAYYQHAKGALIPWDDTYLTQRMPLRRKDGSIFLSLASFRDENCPNTLHEAYTKAAQPKLLFVGLVQQNCYDHCHSGVQAQGGTVSIPPDDDCYDIFCKAHPSYCQNVRLLPMTENESLGPYAARFFASKLWWGESWYMQIDAHTLFVQNWDSSSIDMLHQAPSEKPVISHYPPGHKMDLTAQALKPGGRLCGPTFATNPTENQMIRLEGLGRYDRTKIDIPRFAPFVAAGYFLAHSDFLREVPFDPLLPWIFMGEEIIMSTRLWTSGYDIFSPSHAVVSHIYKREHKPKFWESIHRFLQGDQGNQLEILVLNRIKHQLGYPESARDFIPKQLGKTLLAHLPRYGMGKVRPLKDYLKSVGLDVIEKAVTITKWCETGRVPPGMEHLQHLYPIENYVEEEQDAHAKENAERIKARKLTKQGRGD